MPATASGVSRWSRFLLPGSRYHLLALAFFVVVFGIIPFSIYAHSGEGWGFPLSELMSIAALGLVLFIGGAVLIRLLAALNARAASTTAIALFCLGVFLLLAHVYAPIQIGPLDGSKMVTKEPMLATIVEVILASSVAVVCWALLRGRGLTIAAAFSMLLGIVTVGYGVALSLADASVTAPESALSRTEKLAEAGSAIEGNVYHIVLDTMQTDAFLFALSDKARAQDFDGFTLFKNNVANYILTVPSSASYLTGTLHMGHDYKSWVRQAHSKGMFSTLWRRGYRTSVFVPFESWKDSNYIDHYYYDLDVYAQEIGVGSASFYELIHVWLASLAPNLLTAEALPVAAKLRDPLFHWLTGANPPLSYADGVHPYASMLFLRKLRREEASRPPRGEYFYVHAILPHHPFVLDRNCRYVGVRGGKRAYLNQAKCAIQLVGDFLTELKRLGRYDAATVLVHADTGKGIVGIDGDTRPSGSRTLGRSDSKLIHSVNALLMIKPPHAKGPLRISKTPTQLVDLFPTVLDILDLEPRYAMHGRSVFGVESDAPRQARFAFDPDNKRGSNFVYLRLEDPLDLEHSRLTVLGPASDAGLWGPEAGELATGARGADSRNGFDERE